MPSRKRIAIGVRTRNAMTRKDGISHISLRERGLAPGPWNLDCGLLFVDGEARQV